MFEFNERDGKFFYVPKNYPTYEPGEIKASLHEIKAGKSEVELKATLRVLALHQEIPEDLLEEYFDDFPGASISSGLNNLSDEFISRHFDELNLDLALHRNSGMDLVQSCFPRLDKKSALIEWDFPEEFLGEALENGEVSGRDVSYHQTLSEEFMETQAEHLDWEVLTQTQDMSEEFMERNSDRILWKRVPLCQDISERFVEAHEDKMFGMYVDMLKEGDL
jgi:hypothetical protein